MRRGSKNMKKYFPLFVDLTEKDVLVVGGGTIAGRRVHTLLGFVDKITVVAPELGKRLQELQEQGKIAWIQDVYRKEYLSVDMVLAATDKKEVNDQVQQDCIAVMGETGRHILFSRSDDKSQCDFFFPSIVEKDGIVIGINSGGASPTGTKRIRREIEGLLQCESGYRE